MPSFLYPAAVRMNRLEESQPARRALPLGGVSDELMRQQVYITPRLFLAPTNVPLPSSIRPKLQQVEQNAFRSHLDPTATVQAFKQIVKEEVLRDEIASKRLPGPENNPHRAPPVIAEPSTNCVYPTRARPALNNRIKEQLKFPKALVAQSEQQLREAKVGAFRRERSVFYSYTTQASPAISDPTASVRKPQAGVTPTSAEPANSPRPFSAPSSAARAPGGNATTRTEGAEDGGLDAVRRKFNLHEIPETPGPGPAPRRAPPPRLDLRQRSVSPAPASSAMLSPAPSSLLSAGAPSATPAVHNTFSLSPAPGIQASPGARDAGPLKTPVFSRRAVPKASSAPLQALDGPLSPGAAAAVAGGEVTPTSVAPRRNGNATATAQRGLARFGSERAARAQRSTRSVHSTAATAACVEESSTMLITASPSFALDAKPWAIGAEHQRQRQRRDDSSTARDQRFARAHANQLTAPHVRQHTVVCEVRGTVRPARAAAVTAEGADPN